MVYVLLSHQLMMFEDPKYTYDSLVHDRPLLVIISNDELL